MAGSWDVEGVADVGMGVCVDGREKGREFCRCSRVITICIPTVTLVINTAST
jgi:hypothetical protein